MKRISLILISLILASCATETKIAYECPSLVLPPSPALPITTLNNKSTPDEVIKAWVATAYAYRSWSNIVQNQVNTAK